MILCILPSMLSFQDKFYASKLILLRDMFGKTPWYSIDISGNDRQILLFYKKFHFCHLLPFAKVGEHSFLFLLLLFFAFCLLITYPNNIKPAFLEKHIYPPSAPHFWGTPCWLLHSPGPGCVQDVWSLPLEPSPAPSAAESWPHFLQWSATESHKHARLMICTVLSRNTINLYY